MPYKCQLSLFLIDPAILLLGIYPTDMFAHVLNEFTMLFIAALMQPGRKLEIIQMSIKRLN